MNADDWNERYRTTDRLWSAGPNQFVERELAELSPGHALDLAAGEGRNAIWLAERGWRVTAVDFADVAIARGREAARDRGLTLDWVIADILRYHPAPGRFDLVLLAYLQLPWPDMQIVLSRAAAALAPGGTLFVIGHDRTNLDRGHGGPKSADVLYTPEQVAAHLSRLRVLRAETVERQVDTEDGPKTALDCLVRAVSD